MSKGYPRWIRQCPNVESETRSLHGLGSLVSVADNPPPLHAKASPVLVGALPSERLDVAGLRSHFARTSRVCGTGGEQDTK